MAQGGTIGAACREARAIRVSAAANRHDNFQPIALCERVLPMS
jgi:hypothetical protein